MPKPLYDEKPVFDLVNAHLQTRIVEIAIRIGFFEAIAEPVDLAVLSQRLSIGKRATKTIASVLTACGLVHCSLNRIQLTGIGREYFLAGSPFFKGDLFNNLPSDQLKMLREVHLQDGMPRPLITQWMAGRVPAPEWQARHMHAHSFAAATVFAQHPVFARTENVLDVAGGVGSFSVALASFNRDIRCTVLDLSPMSAPAKLLFEQWGVAARVQFVAGDMFKAAWQSNYDAIVISNIFHDWETAKCKTLAQKAWAAIRPGGRVFVSEILFNDDNDGPLAAALFSAGMMLTTEGTQFTYSELKTMLQEVGFLDVEIVGVFGYYSLVSGLKA